MILYSRHMPPEELAVARQHCACVNSRVLARGPVIGRYHGWPDYAELHHDVALAGGQLVNSAREHAWVADMGRWTEDMADVTPTTWRFGEEPRGPGPYVLKGAWKSRKDKWNELMYAATPADVVRIACRLMDDTLLGEGDIWVRQYVPLERLGTGINGVPLSNEWRVFALNGRPLAHGFYWEAHRDQLEREPDISDMPMALLADLCARVSCFIRFAAIDVARTADGEWIVVEVNDGQQSGLNGVDAGKLYGALARAGF